MVIGHIDLPTTAIESLCRKYHVKELALFGSALRDDFRPDSDIDLLVEYEPDARVSLLDHIGLQHDFEDLLARRVDLVSKGGLKKLIRRHVIESSRVVYRAA